MVNVESSGGKVVTLLNICAKIGTFAIASSLATAAFADTVNVNGDTTGGATWNRPVGGNPPTPPVSGVGTATRYEVTQFTVGQAGAYDFLSVATTGWDNYLFLYQTSFDPTDQFANVIIGNDDFPVIGMSGFDGVNLLTGVSYLAVSTGFANDDFGAYVLTISGPGTITIGGGAVPEPATWAIMILGFGLVGGAMRSANRRQKLTVSFS